MHPRVRDVRRPDAGIDPRGSGDGRPPLLQGHLKRHKGGDSPADAGESSASSAAQEPASPTGKAAATSKPAAKRLAPRPAATRPAATRSVPKASPPKAKPAAS